MKIKFPVIKCTAACLMCFTVFAACTGKAGEKEKRILEVETFEEEPEDDSPSQLWKKLNRKEYPEELIDLVKRNPETYDFVLSFNEESGKDHDIDLGELDNTDSVPYLCQWDVRWGFEKYNNKYFALTGCGPTCLSMVAIYLTGNGEYSPLWMGQFLDSHGYAVPGTGTAWSIFDDGIVEIGLYGTELETSYEAISEALGKDEPVIASMSRGDFTAAGHFVVFVSCEDNSIMIYDPNSKERTKLWDYSDLEPQIARVWAMHLDYEETTDDFSEWDETDEYSEFDYSEEY